MSKITLVVQYFQSDRYGYGDLYLSESGEVLGLVYENDGDWRHEYFNPIFKRLGVKIIKGKLDEAQVEELLRRELGE